MLSSDISSRQSPFLAQPGTRATQPAAAALLPQLTQLEPDYQNMEVLFRSIGTGLSTSPLSDAASRQADNGRLLAQLRDYYQRFLSSGDSEEPNLLWLLIHYNAAEGGFDFAENDALTGAMGRALNLYGSAAAEGDAGPGWKQAIQDRLLLAISDAMGVTFPADLPRQLSGMTVSAARDALVDRLVVILSHSRMVGRDPAQNELLRKLAVQLAPVVVPDLLWNRTDIPADMTYGGRKWGDAMVGAKVAAGNSIDAHALTTPELMALGESALRAESGREVAAEPEALTLGQYKLLRMAMAQGRLGPDALNALQTPEARSEVAQTLSAFAAEMYPHALQFADAQKRMREEPPSRREVARRIILDKGDDPGRSVNIINDSGLSESLSLLDAYLSRGGDFNGSLQLPPLNIKFNEAFEDYKGRVSDAFQRGLYALTATQLGRDPGEQASFKLHRPKLDFELTQIESSSFDDQIFSLNSSGGAIQRGSFTPLPLRYIVENTAARPDEPRFYFFSPDKAAAMKPLPPGTDLSRWVSEHRDALFDAQEMDRVAGNGIAQQYTASTNASDSGTLDTVLTGAKNDFAQQVQQSKSKYYEETPAEAWRGKVVGALKGLIPFYDMAQAISENKPDQALFAGLLDIAGLLPVLGQGAKLGTAGARLTYQLAISGIRDAVQHGAMTALTRVMASSAREMPSLLKSLGKLGVSLVDAALPFGLPNAKPRVPRVAEMVAPLTDHPNLAARLQTLAPSTQGDVLKLDNLWVAKDNVVPGGSIRVGKNNYQVGQFEDLRNVIVKQHGEGSNAYFSLVNPHTDEAFGARLKLNAASGKLEVCELARVDPWRLPTQDGALSQAHLNDLRVVDESRLEYLNTQRRRSPDEKYFRDASGDKYIPMGEAWYRFDPNAGNTTGVIRKGGRTDQLRKINVAYTGSEWVTIRGPVQGGQRAGVTSFAITNPETLASLNAGKSTAKDHYFYIGKNKYIQIDDNWYSFGINGKDATTGTVQGAGSSVKVRYENGRWDFEAAPTSGVGTKKIDLLNQIHLPARVVSPDALNTASNIAPFRGNANKKLSDIKEGLLGAVKPEDGGMLAKKNVAFAEYDIPAIKGLNENDQLISVSGFQHIDGIETFPDSNRTYKAYIVDGLPRHNDTEIKILDRLTKNIDGTGRPAAEVTGSIYLFTDLVPCKSCETVISEFSKRFPGIKLHVDSPNGVLSTGA